MANPYYRQKLEKALDLTGYFNELSQLFSSNPEKLNDAILESKDELSDYQDIGKMYNFSRIDKRPWLQSVLLDVEKEEETRPIDQPITEYDLKVLIKLHKLRRALQKQYHSDVGNMQYMYYGAGLLSEIDHYPENRKRTLNDLGCLPQAPPPPNYKSSVTAQHNLPAGFFLNSSYGSTGSHSHLPSTNNSVDYVEKKNRKKRRTTESLSHTPVLPQSTYPDIVYQASEMSQILPSNLLIPTSSTQPEFVPTQELVTSVAMPPVPASVHVPMEQVPSPQLLQSQASSSTSVYPATVGFASKKSKYEKAKSNLLLEEYRLGGFESKAWIKMLNEELLGKFLDHTVKQKYRTVQRRVIAEAACEKVVSGSNDSTNSSSKKIKKTPG